MQNTIKRTLVATAVTCVLGGAILLAPSGLLAVDEPGEMREWSDKSGKFRIRAAYVDSQGGMVRLRKEDGTTKAVPLNVLSAADVTYVRGLGGGAAKSGADMPLVKSYIELSRLSQSYRSSVLICQMYEDFINHPAIDIQEKDLAQSQYEKWQELAAEKRVRSGSKWITPAEQEKLSNQTYALMREAWRLVEVKQNQLAGEKLIEASKGDLEDTRPDFALGLLFALPGRDAGSAEQHFDKCVKRLEKQVGDATPIDRANHVAALNNLAIARVRLGKHAEAIRHWNAAAELAPPAPELLQNLGRYLALATAKQMAAAPRTAVKNVGSLYARLTSSSDEQAYHQQTGWLYMCLISEGPPEKDSPGAPKRPQRGSANPAPGQSRVIGTGTGFAIHAGGYVLTNRHVVKDADRLLIVAPGEKEPKPAEVIVVSETDDLAIIRCREVDFPVVPLASALPRRGTDILVLGYPDTARFGTTLKATRGTVTALPSADTQNMLMFDAAANPGNSGGPVCDEFACVIGVLTATTKDQIHNYTQGVPALAALDLAKKHIPEFKPVDAAAKKLAWPDVDEAVSRSTVLVLIEKFVVDVGIADSNPEDDDEDDDEDDRSDFKKKVGLTKRVVRAFEDPWCMICHGFGRRDCLVKDCKNGSVRTFERVLVSKNPKTGQEIYEKRAKRVDCGACDKGKIACKHCWRGFDPSVR